jgi:aspartyl-tRNA(Asn)/glutamyl-tRNA(Gln) amidotransferase subunit B
MKWETVIGLEVHAELSTKSKIFCGCSTAFGGEPNTQVCPVCAGMPGVLPYLNRAVVEYAARLGIALDCTITQDCKFDRKNYFYPDLPKAYQVSQLYAPICREGYLEIETEGRVKRIGIREIHMEEDAGKLIHDADSEKTWMDFNRCGVPLLEIVSQPDFNNSAEVIAYLEKLREILLYLDISDCKMQEGSLRFDINLSVRRPGENLGVRTEMKNLNSFKAVGRAIEYETARQIKILTSGQTVVQETRRWDDNAGESYAMRSKENAQDYRYFPEPDLLPVRIDATWLTRLKNNLPELAQQKRERYTREFALTAQEALVLTGHRKIALLFEKIAAASGDPIEAAHLVSGEILRLMNATNTLPEELDADSGKLAALVTLLAAGKINRNAYKETIEAVFSQKVDPEEYIRAQGLLIQSGANDAALAAVKAALCDNPNAVADYLSGKEKSFGFLMGQAMRRAGKSVNPETVKKMLEDLLGQY